MLPSQEVIRMDAKAEKIALFRYGLIANLVLPLPRGELTRRAEEIAARHYEIPSSQRTSVSVDTLLDWALRYRNGGFEALAPQPRQDRGQSRTITPQLADLIERLKRENPHRTGTTLLRELALSGQNEPAISSTLYRFLSAASPNANCWPLRRTRSSKPNSPTRSGSRTCSMVPMSGARAAARCRPCYMPSSTTPAGSSRTPSSMPAKVWTFA
jgi:transposase